MVAVLLLTLAASPSTSTTEADALFARARELLKGGRAAEACPLFDKSHALDPALGTLLNLADCEERTGQLVRAYLHFNEAATWAYRTHEAQREDAAHARAAALKPKLSWVALSAGEPIPHLTVRVGSFRPVDTLPQSMPVDPGEVEIHAEAPGFRAWTTKVQVPAAQSVAVAIPALESGQPPVVVHETPPPPVAQATATAPPEEHKPTGAIATMAAGGAVLGASVLGLAWSFDTYNRYQRQQAGGPDFANPTVSQSDFNTLGWLYPASWVAAGLGAAALASGTRAPARRR